MNEANRLFYEVKQFISKKFKSRLTTSTLASEIFMRITERTMKWLQHNCFSAVGFKASMAGWHVKSFFSI